MSELPSQFSLNFFQKKPLEVKFSDLDLSSDAGILLVRQVEENLKIREGIAEGFTDKRDPSKVKHPLNQLISQRVYQIAAGYEDANDSNYLRQDPIFKLAGDRVPLPGENLLASQPTMSRLENQVTKRDIQEIRGFFIDKFLQSYSRQPEEIVLDIDGWDAITYGEQQLSLFHGYYGQSIYFPVLINEATSGYPSPAESGKLPSWERSNRDLKMVILAAKKSSAWSEDCPAGRCGVFLARNPYRFANGVELTMFLGLVVMPS